jgi:hypothetical protein
MMRILAIAILIFLIAPIGVRAQYVVSNDYVEADVSGDGLGIVTCYYANTGREQYFMYPGQRSYLTVVVNGVYYTNNIQLKTAGTYTVLRGGVNQKIADTVETVWQPEGAKTFDLIQDVYPVAFPLAGSGQVVFKFSIRNYQSKALTAQAQYLLDVDLAEPGHASDSAPITTRYGYMDTGWVTFPDSVIAAIPPYFISTAQPMDSANFPLQVSMGYTTDSLAPEPMGLMEPSLMSYVDWREVAIYWTWGGPTRPIEYKQVGDDALLFQWSQISVKPGDSVGIGRFSDGTAACMPMCTGPLDAMTIHPDHIAWNPISNKYIPNRFPVDAIVWNTNLTQSVVDSGSQTITNALSGVENGPIKIVSPLPILSNGYRQAHELGKNGIAKHSAAAYSWEDTVLASVLTNCLTDSSYDLTFAFSVFDKQPPTFTNGACSCPINVDCEERDVTPPRHSKHVVIGSANSCGHNTAYGDSVFDDLSTDQGLQNITWEVSPNPNAVTVNVQPFLPCTNATVPIIITQTDTALASCVYLTFTDCAGNVSYDSVCFQSCVSRLIDSISPKFRLVRSYDYNNGKDSSCSFEASAWTAVDSQGSDGLKYVTAIDSTNMTAIVLAFAEGSELAQFEAFVLDSTKPGQIIVKAADEVGNVAFDTIRYCPGTAGVNSESEQTISLSIFPSPVEDMTTILLSGAPSADVEIFDVLGREVDRFRVDGSYDWETGGLPRGTYIMRIAMDGRVVSKRVTKR